MHYESYISQRTNQHFFDPHATKKCYNSTFLWLKQTNKPLANAKAIPYLGEAIQIMLSWQPLWKCEVDISQHYEDVKVWTQNLICIMLCHMHIWLWVSVCVLFSVLNIWYGVTCLYEWVRFGKRCSLYIIALIEAIIMGSYRAQYIYIYTILDMMIWRKGVLL